MFSPKVLLEVFKRRINLVLGLKVAVIFAASVAIFFQDLAVIANTHQNTVGKAISKEKLLKLLAEIEKTGIIRSQVVSKEDEPIQIWKTAMSFGKLQKSKKATGSFRE